MAPTFDSWLDEMDSLFVLLEKHVPSPVPDPRGKSFVYRYKERSPQQAIIQKLARSITGLRSANILLQSGYYQEVGVLQRVVDDFHEEILFLGFALLADDVNEVHKRFLDGFYDEVYEDPTDPVASLSRKRNVVRRADIRFATKASMLKLKLDTEDNLNQVNDLSRAIGLLYNSFMHGGSSQILEMYGGTRPHFHLRGMLGTPREQEHTADLVNHFIRSAQSFLVAAMVFDDSVAHSHAESLLRSMSP